MVSVVLGLVGFVFCAWFMAANPSVTFHGFFDLPAFILLTFAPIFITLISHNFIDFLAGLRTVFSMASLNYRKEMDRVVDQLSHLNGAVRNDGMGVLIQFKDKVKNPLLKDGLSLILNSFSAQEIKHNLTAKINNRQSNYAHAANLFESLGKLSPGVGLLGTILGLVHMLANLSDPTKIGASMAAALLATLYGLIYGNVVYLPVSEKINIHAEKMLQLDTMILEGVLLLKEKKSTAHLRDVVSTYTKQNQPKTQQGDGGAPQNRAPNGRAG